MIVARQIVRRAHTERLMVVLLFLLYIIVVIVLLYVPVVRIDSLHHRAELVGRGDIRCG